MQNPPCPNCGSAWRNGLTNCCWDCGYDWESVSVDAALARLAEARVRAEAIAREARPLSRAARATWHL